MNEYSSWVIRYVPNAFRGEYINIGVLVGNTHHEWAVKYVDDFRRASSIGGDTQQLLPILRELARRIYPASAQATLGISSLSVSTDPMTVKDIEHARIHKNNVLQYSEPRISHGLSAEELVQVLFENYVFEE